MVALIPCGNQAAVLVHCVKYRVRNVYAFISI